MRTLFFILGSFLVSQVHAQLVVNLADFASNPSKFNGRHIVLRGVTLSKNSASGLSLNGPQTISGTTPTSAPNMVGSATLLGAPANALPGTPQGTTLNANGAASTSATTQASAAPSTPNRNNTCVAPKDWEILEVEIPNYKSCFTLYSNMAKSIPTGRKVNADITILVDTHLMHRITRVKLN